MSDETDLTGVADEAVQPDVEPKAETEGASVVEPAAEPVAEPEVEPVVELEAEPVVESTDAAAETATKPAPKPAPPKPRPPVPAPPAQRVPGSPGPRRAAGQVPSAPAPLDQAQAAAAAEFGRVDDDGTVYVQDGDTERVVGQVPGQTGTAAMDLYIRRYLELSSRAGLLAARLESPEVKVGQIASAYDALKGEVVEPAAVGDLAALRSQVDALGETIQTRRAQIAAERAAARDEATAARTSLIEKAEALAATDPARTHWKRTTDEFRALMEEWRAAQRDGARLDKAAEDDLWKRFSAARGTFEQNRRAHFAALDAESAEAKGVKADLVARAEQLATSTVWGASAGEFRDLMTQWKAAGRAGRKDDDALWERFRAAQDAFFQARTEASHATDVEYGANLAAKEALLAQAEALLPVTDLAAAKAALRDIQEKWEAAGKVPRQAMGSVEGRLRAVETAVRDAESKQWRTSDPEKRARASSAVTQLETLIEGLEAELAAAKAAGDKRKVSETSAALEARRSWLEQIRKSNL